MATSLAITYVAPEMDFHASQVTPAQQELDNTVANSVLREVGANSGVSLGSSAEGINSPGQHHKVVKYPYIDALRGYAVLLVILSHTGGVFPELPYPIKKLTNQGWSGVQLFFLVSCVTLMMSWRSDEKKRIASPARFWIRRYFRIAPMYYLAALFYFLVEPPVGGFDLQQLLASLTFINAWHPILLSTVDGGWRVVPGGWSISVEFSFYMIFPLIVHFVRTPRSGVLFSAIAIAIGAACNSFTQDYFLQEFDKTAVSNFLYFWLPNQLFVFGLGTLLFFVMEAFHQDGAPGWLKWHPSIQILMCVLFVVVLGEYPSIAPQYFTLNVMSGLPLIFYDTLALMLFALLLAANPSSIWVNRPIRLLGTFSFSAYIFHFFVLHQLASSTIIDATHRTGVTAIMICGLLFAFALLITFAISMLTYQFIEKPMIKLGARLSNLGSRKTR